MTQRWPGSLNALARTLRKSRSKSEPGKLISWPRSVIQHLAATAPRHYKSLDGHCIADPPGHVKWRHFDVPSSDLKGLQRRLLRDVMAPRVAVGEFQMGLKGRSVLHHASLHEPNPVLVTLDIADCFRRISHESVFAMWLRLGVSPGVASLLTQLTTVNGYLPQGAPTSPLICALRLQQVLDRILDFCQSRSLDFSVYVDDLAISGQSMDPNEVIAYVTEQLSVEGLGARNRKTNVMHQADRVVTGIWLEGGLHVCSDFVRSCRTLLEDLLKETEPDPSAIQRARGSASYVRHINPSQGRDLWKMACQLPRLPPMSRRESLMRWQRCRGGRQCRAALWHPRVRQQQ